MGKQNPRDLLQAANDKTPINPITDQPEVRYNHWIKENCHPFGISGSERELGVSLSLNCFFRADSGTYRSTRWFNRHNVYPTFNPPRVK